MADAADSRARLRADCARCAGLCCVAPAFAASADFAIDKPAGHACPHPMTAHDPIGVRYCHATAAAGSEGRGCVCRVG